MSRLLVAKSRQRMKRLTTYLISTHTRLFYCPRILFTGLLRHQALLVAVLSYLNLRRTSSRKQQGHHSCLSQTPTNSKHSWWIRWPLNTYNTYDIAL